MNMRKMIFEGITYNVMTDKEIAEFELRKELDTIHELVEDGSMECISFEQFEKERKEKYGL